MMEAPRITVRGKMSERSPMMIPESSVGIVCGLSGMAFALTQKMFPTLVEYLTFHGAFYVYALMAFILTAWAVVTIKLTDGLSLVETQRLYDGRTARSYDSGGAARNCSSR